jgi:threonine dehydratase
MIRDLVDTHVTVTEREIASAMLFSFNDLRVVTEGGGAVGLAAMLADRWRPPVTRDGPIVIVVSGGNVDLSKLAALRT